VPADGTIAGEETGAWNTAALAAQAAAAAVAIGAVPMGGFLEGDLAMAEDIPPTSQPIADRWADPAPPSDDPTLASVAISLLAWTCISRRQNRRADSGF
jgi:hypothetical protein